VEMKNILFTKQVKLLTLALTGMLIVSVSALVYYSLSATATITTATTDVWFMEGADASEAGVSLSPDNTTVTLTDLRAYPNATYTYTDPIKVRNNSTGSSYNIRLRPVSLSGNNTEFVFVNFTLQSSPTLRSLNYTCNGASWTTPSTTSWISIPASTEWSITIETKAKDSAASASVTIEIAVDVE
jgi:hypothetical protein